MTEWNLLCAATSHLPKAPKAITKSDKEHRMMAFQWWKRPDSDSAWVPVDSGNVFPKIGDDLVVNVVRYWTDEKVKMQVRFKNVHPEGPSSSPVGSGAVASEAKPKGEVQAGQFEDDPYEKYYLWEIPKQEIVNGGTFSITVDFDPLSNNPKYYLDPLLRVDPGSKKK